MVGFVVRRLVRASMTLACILTLVFVLTRLSGDPTQWLLPDDAGRQAHDEMRASLGLNLPIHVQYARYLLGLVHGDFGESYQYLRPVGSLFVERLPATLPLGGLAFALAVAVGIPLGVVAARFRNSVADRLLMSVAVAGHTVPNFVLGILGIFLFSLILHALPSGGSGSPAHFVLPVLTLAAGATATIARLTRSSMLEVLHADYLDTARAKGVTEPVVVVRHALRNALGPVLTVIGLELGTLIGGAVVVETVFAWPGIGSLVVNAAKSRDFPVIQFGTLLIAATMITCNLLVDLSYSVLDPRIRTASGRTPAGAGGAAPGSASV